MKIPSGYEKSEGWEAFKYLSKKRRAPRAIEKRETRHDHRIFDQK